MSERRIDTHLLSASGGRTNYTRHLDSSPSHFRALSGGPYGAGGVRSFEQNGAAGMMRGGSPRLTDALHNVFHNQQQCRQAVEVLEVEEKCALHPKEINIALDDGTGQFGCNKCVFEKRIKDPLFMAIFARQTKRKYDEMYELMLTNITAVEDFTPSTVTQRIQSNIKDFFADIYTQLKEMEKDILYQIKSSQNLKELGNMTQTLNIQFDEELLNKLEKERSIIEDKVGTARYAYIVTRKQYYRQLIKEMEDFNVQITSKIERSNTMFENLIKIDYDQGQLFERIYDLVDGFVLVNNKKIQRKQPPKSEELLQEVPLFSREGFVRQEERKGDIFSPFKTPHDKTKLAYSHQDGGLSQDSAVDSGMKANVRQFSQAQEEEESQLVNNFYNLKNNEIFKHNYQSKTSTKVFTVDHCHYPKLAFTQKERVFLLGGAKDQGQNEVVNTNYEVLLNTGNGAAIAERKPMQVARLGFGCCIDNYGDRLYVIGGSVGKHKATDKCEYYDIESDNWVSLPNLSEPRFSHTLCVFNDEWLFAFGGFNKDQNLLTKIERYDISTEKAKQWEVLNVKLPYQVSSPGAFQVSQKEIVIFGGWSTDNVVQTMMMLQQTQNEFKFDLENVGELQDGDIFLFTGAFRQDVDKGEVVVCGKDYLHLFKEKERRFETVRKLF